MNTHMERIISSHPELEPCAAEITAAFGLMRDAFARGGKALLCGNGGSAADCEHWAAELLKGFERKRPLDAAARSLLPEALAAGLQGALPAVALTGFVSLSSAFANDVNAAFIFAQLTWALGRSGDVLIAISTSGSSANVCYALQAAGARGMKSIALTGGDGGRMAGMADVVVKVPGSRTCEIQELHLPVYHCICLMLEDEFFGE